MIVMIVAARPSHAWRNPRLAGFVALLFTALTLFAAAPHPHAGTNGTTASAASAITGNIAAAVISPLAPAALSSCALCDWLVSPALPAAVSFAPLARTGPAFLVWVPAPLASVRARVLFPRRPRGPPAHVLS